MGDIYNSPEDVCGSQDRQKATLHFTVPDAELVASPVMLPCGRVVPNRLVKVCFSR